MNFFFLPRPHWKCMKAFPVEAAEVQKGYGWECKAGILQHEIL